MTWRFIHAADVHLDSPLLGLERYEGAPVEAARRATREAFSALVSLAESEGVRLVVLAGDNFDGPWKDYRTGLFFVEQMARLGRADIRVFLVRGNHDAQNRSLKNLAFPRNVHEFSAHRAQTVRLEDLGVAIHGQSFGESAVEANLAAQYPDAVPGLFNIGVLHTSLTGREGHDPYAPCTVDTLVSRGYQYWALGHVHAREVVREDPPIVYPGNLQGRHIRETGLKGCTLVTVEDDRVARIEHRPLCRLRFEVATVDVSGERSPDAVVEAAIDAVAEQARTSADIPLAVRIRVTGVCAAHAALLRDPERWRTEIRARAVEEGDGAWWVEKVEFRTRSPGDSAATRDMEALGHLLQTFDSLLESPPPLPELAPVLAELQTKLPPAVREGSEPLHLDDPVFLKDALREARDLLLARLTETEP